MGERRGIYRVLVVKPEGKKPLWRPSIDGRVTLRWIFSKWNMGVRTGSSWLRICQVAGKCKCSNEPLGSIKCGEFLD